MAGAAIVAAGALGLSSCGGSGGSSPRVPPATPEIIPAYAVTVTNVNDSGAGSLRVAINEANADMSGSSTISFTVKGTIVLDRGLPSLTHPR